MRLHMKLNKRFRYEPLRMSPANFIKWLNQSGFSYYRIGKILQLPKGISPVYWISKDVRSPKLKYCWLAYCKFNVIFTCFDDIDDFLEVVGKEMEKDTELERLKNEASYSPN